MQTGSIPGLDGTWVSDRDANSTVTIAGRAVTMTVPGFKPVSYEQEVSSDSDGYVLYWRKEDGEVLRIRAYLDKNRLKLEFDGQEFALRRKAAQ